MPTTVEQIQAIVRIANEHKVPLWPHGQGKNNGYGGAAPRVKGSVIVSLRNMNRVLEIDEELGFAVVEPGVRWFDLYERSGKAATGSGCPVPTSDGAASSETRSTTASRTSVRSDFGPRAGWRSCSPTAICCERAWELCPATSRGICTSAAWVRCSTPLHAVELRHRHEDGPVAMPQPACYMPLWIRAWKDDDLGPLIDTFRALMLDGTIEGVPQILNTLDMAAMITTRADWYDGEGPIPEARIDEMARELELGRWIMRLAIYGDEPVVDHRFQKIKAAFERIPGVEVQGTKHDPETVATLEQPAELVQAGVPNLDINRMTGWYGGEEGGHIGFSPVAPMTGRTRLHCAISCEGSSKTRRSSTIRPRCC